MDSTETTEDNLQVTNVGTMNNGENNAHANSSKNVVPPKQTFNRVGARPPRFFQPPVIQAKDRYYEERRTKNYQQGRKKRIVQKVYKLVKESALWLEHVAILKKAGMDLDSPNWKRR